MVSGNFGEMSEDTHLLMAAMANSRMRVAGPICGRRGWMQGEEAERSNAVSAIQRRLGVMAFRCQSSSLLNRLETLSPGGAAAAENDVRKIMEDINRTTLCILNFIN